MHDKEKQIEELARYCCLHCEKEYCGRCVEGFDPGRCTAALDTAEAIYNAGYRKKIEGEWEQKGLWNPRCSVCKAYSNYEGNFCPNCGAKMKGGESDA